MFYHIWHDCAVMYHVFRCVNELLLIVMACLIVAVTYIFYSEN
jgi:hypothetical protein